MDIRLLTKEDMEQAERLWKAAFGDSDSFIRTYFDLKVLPGNSLGLFDGSLISVLHMIPYRLRVQGREMQSAFIAGAATSAERRGEGHMRTLLYESLRLMRERGIHMTHLHPFRHSFYEKFGWATYTYGIMQNVKNADEIYDGEIGETHDWTVLDSLYQSMMQRFDGYVLRGEREWRWRLMEIASDGGKAIVLKKGGVPKAYMLYYPGDEKTQVIETVYEDESDITPLLSYLYKKKKGTIEYWLPCAPGTGAAPRSMARVVDVRKLLEYFGAEELLERYRITDGFAEWNNIGSGVEDISAGELAKIVHLGAGQVLGETKRGTKAISGTFLHRVPCIFEEY